MSQHRDRAMEPSDSPLISEKTCNVVRLILLTLQKGACKSKLVFLMRRGKILREALRDLVLRHHTDLGCCRNDDVRSPVRRRDYEFSCSDSPALYRYGRWRARGGGGHAPPRGEAAEVEASPLVGPAGRPVRVTDSPYPIGDSADVDCHVDRAAEEFIERFYRQLRSQRWTAATTPVRDVVYRYG